MPHSRLSQLSPVQPGWQAQSPVRRSQSPPWWHSQRCWQSGPCCPWAHSGRGHTVKHHPDTHCPERKPHHRARGCAPHSTPSLRWKPGPRRGRFAPEPICERCRRTGTHPARRPALSTLRGKRRAPWQGHKCHRSGRGSAGGSSSHRNLPGTLREKQANVPVRKCLQRQTA